MARGDGVAVAVGDGVAVAVGDGVALAVGDGVAVAVGDGVAVAVGDGVALAVGDGVAVTVSVSPSSSSAKPMTRGVNVTVTFIAPFIVNVHVLPLAVLQAPPQVWIERNA